MPDDIPVPVPVMPPRPTAPEGRAAALADRMHALRHDPRVAVLALVVVALGAGAYWFHAGTAPIPAASASPRSRTTASTTATTTRSSNGSSTTSTTKTSATSATVVVDVAGAVAKPGVVTLRANSRVIDAIAAAGGAHPDADLGRLNLAALLTDGQRIAVPVRGQPAPPLDPTTASGGGAPNSSSTAAGGEPSASQPLNLNSATQQQLELLPGIGPTFAAAILAERDRAGGFHSVEDLRRVRGIGDARYAQIAPLVTV
ncbi:MAG: uptake protein [Actinomycetia bacterium]|nr:uptake protein [Actinomycetes bacterium]